VSLLSNSFRLQRCVKRPLSGVWQCVKVHPVKTDRKFLHRSNYCLSPFWHRWVCLLVRSSFNTRGWTLMSVVHGAVAKQRWISRVLCRRWSNSQWKAVGAKGWTSFCHSECRDIRYVFLLLFCCIELHRQLSSYVAHDNLSFQWFDAVHLGEEGYPMDSSP